MIIKRADLLISRQSAELRKLSQAVEQSANTVVITDVQGNIEYVNPKFAETTGYTVEEVRGQNPRILKSGQQDAEFYQKLWQTIMSGREWHGEFHNKRKDRSLYWEQATIAPISDARGKITHFIAVKEDITERKRAEEALRESRQQLESFYYREQQRRQLSDTLREVGRIVSSTLEQEKVLELILAQLEHVITFHRATVSLLNGNILTLVAGLDKLGGTIPSYSYIADEYPINAEVLRAQSPVLVPDVNRDERWRQTPTMQGIRSFLCAPLLVKDQPIGILAVGSINETPYTKEDAETVFAFATQVAIAVYNAQLHAEVRTRIERELLTAQQIQKSLLPHDIPDIMGLEIAGFSQPAREVGGDFFNVFVFNEQHLGIAVGDVSGKGMEAALMMALSFGLLTTEVHRAATPSALMKTLNRELRPHTRHNKMNTALGYLSLTTPNGAANGQWMLQAVNAGLIAPLIRHADGTMTWLDVAGLPLGAVRTPDYSEFQEMLAPGDFIFLTTDGLVEAMNREGEMYGFERLTQSITAADCQSANSMLACVLQNLRHFIGDAEVYDDWTIVVAKIRSDFLSRGV
ncbi:PAS sensor protein [Candidatus Vecturithrix granuli]|uniref:PAS sensor protein n=1 Tax=Vecturithrix granuli TaxID=1499967 RepID=A0A081BUV5_VECG1|nr:PAS sensor protein [Candidatus Vecturithrix granuli]